MEEIPTLIPEAVNEILLMLLFLVFGPVEDQTIKIDHLKEGSYVESMYLEEHEGVYSVFVVKELKKNRIGTITVSNLKNYRREPNPFSKPSEREHNLIFDFGSPYIAVCELPNWPMAGGFYDKEKGHIDFKLRIPASGIIANHWIINLIEDRMIFHSIDTDDTYIVRPATSSFKGNIQPAGAINSEAPASPR